MEEPVLAWYFASTDRRMRHGGPWLRAGETHSFVGDLVLGDRGFHGCIDPLDALIFGYGPIACRIRLGGERIEGPTRVCAREMEVISLVDAESTLREAAMRAVKNALPESFGSIELDAKVLERLREDGEDRTEALHDGQWAIEQGKKVDLQQLRDDLETAQRNATLVDAALRLNEPAFERLRSAIEDIRNCKVAIELKLEGLEELREDSSAIRSEAETHRGLVANAELLGELLGHLRWVREAAVGTRPSDSKPVLFIDTASRAADRTTAAHRVASALSRIHALPVFVLVFDRVHAFEIDLVHEARFSDGIRPVDAAGTDRNRARALTLVRPPQVPVAEEPMLLVRAQAKPASHVAHVLEPYLTPKPPEPHPTAKPTEPHPTVQPTPAPSVNAGREINARRWIRRTAIGAVSVWGSRRHTELQEELAPFELEPALLVHDNGVERILVSRADTESGFLVHGLRARLVPPELKANLFAPRVLSRIDLMGPLGPRQRLQVRPQVATALGSVSGFPVWSDATRPTDGRARRLAELPWLLAAWRCAGDHGFEALRRGTEPDPREDALELHHALGVPFMVVGFIDSDEWVSVTGCRARAITPRKHRHRKLIYVIDPDAD